MPNIGSGRASRTAAGRVLAVGASAPRRGILLVAGAAGATWAKCGAVGGGHFARPDAQCPFGRKSRGYRCAAPDFRFGLPS